jgi:hypothetical protein
MRAAAKPGREFVYFVSHLRASDAIRVIRSVKTGSMTSVLSVLHRTLLFRTPSTSHTTIVCHPSHSDDAVGTTQAQIPLAMSVSPSNHQPVRSARMTAAIMRSVPKSHDGGSESGPSRTVQDQAR